MIIFIIIIIASKILNLVPLKCHKQVIFWCLPTSSISRVSKMYKKLDKISQFLLFFLHIHYSFITAAHIYAADCFLPMTINVELVSYWNKSDFAVLSFQSHSRTSVTVSNRTVGAVENVNKVAVREDTIEVAEVAEVEGKTVIVGKLLVVGWTLLPL